MSSTLRLLAPLGLSSCILLSPVPAFAASHDIPDVVREALRTDPELREAQQRVRARTEEVTQAEAGFRPSVDLNAGIGYEHTDNPASRAAGNDDIELERQELGITVNQLLFDGGGTRGEIDRQKARLTSAEHRVRGTAESRGLAVVQSYLDLVRRRTQQSLADTNLTAHLRIQDQIRKRSEAGVGRRADLEQINARVALAQTNLEAARVNRIDAETTYLRVVGLAPPAQLSPPADPASKLPPSLDSALATASSSHPLLQVAAADIEAAKAQRAAAQRTLYPRVNLEVNGNLDNNLDGASGHSDEVTAMLRLRYNLFRGGADQARIRQTAFEVNEAMEIRDRTLRQVEETLRLSWAARDATGRQLDYARQRVDFSAATRDAYKKQFNIGQRTLLDLLNTENELFQARQALTDTEYDHKLAGFRILQAEGRLLPALGVTVPSIE